MISLIHPENFNQKLHNKQVNLFTLKNKNGLVSQITNYGARIVSLWTPDKDGNFEDVVLGHESLQLYLDSPELYLGAAIGRYGNRIAKGDLKINGITYDLAQNNGENSLHGGPEGFHAQVWDAKQINDQQLELSYFSKDGEENFPGNVSTTIVYTLTDNNALEIEYKATTDATTVVNLTNHSYFNLKGAGNGTIHEHLLQINANYFIPTNETAIPLGNLESVLNTPMDFTSPTPIGKNINDTYEQLVMAKGYDHSYAFNEDIDERNVAASVLEPTSERIMEVYTNEPGVQLYSGNYVDGAGQGKYGKIYKSQESFCLETQHYPNSPNQDNFPTTLLQPNEEYRSICIYKFGVKS